MTSETDKCPVRGCGEPSEHHGPHARFLGSMWLKDPKLGLVGVTVVETWTEPADKRIEVTLAARDVVMGLELDRTDRAQLVTMLNGRPVFT